MRIRVNAVIIESENSGSFHCRFAPVEMLDVIGSSFSEYLGEY